MNYSLQNYLSIKNRYTNLKEEFGNWNNKTKDCSNNVKKSRCIFKRNKNKIKNYEFRWK